MPLATIWLMLLLFPKWEKTMSLKHLFGYYAKVIIDSYSLPLSVSYYQNIIEIIHWMKNVLFV